MVSWQLFFCPIFFTANIFFGPKIFSAQIFFGQFFFSQIFFSQIFFRPVFFLKTYSFLNLPFLLFVPVTIKVIREKSRGGRFLWNKNWDLGWIWASSATFEAGFFIFPWAKKNFKKHFRRWKHFWHRIKLKKCCFFFLKS